MTKSRRRDRIFIDYLRNAPNATSIAPYSTRAREGAPVSMPLSWDALGATTERPVFDVMSAPAFIRSRPDPWGAMADVKQTLTRRILDAVR